MARPIGLPSSPDRAGTWRIKAAGGGVSADSATLTDALFPATADATNGGAISFYGVESILVAVVLTGGTGPTAELDMLFRDEDAADGSRWKRKDSALALTTSFQEVYVFQSKVYPRLSAVTGSPTQVELIIKPGRFTIGRGPFR